MPPTAEVMVQTGSNSRDEPSYGTIDSASDQYRWHDGGDTPLRRLTDDDNGGDPVVLLYTDRDDANPLPLPSSTFDQPSDTSKYKVKVPSIDDLLDAIKQVETGGNPNLVGDNGQAHGPFQIHKPYFLDALPFAQNIVANPTDYPAAVMESHHAREIVKGYWRRYTKDVFNDVSTGDPIHLTLGLSILARTHNGGPRGADNPATLPYWNKVKAVLIQRGFGL